MVLNLIETLGIWSWFVFGLLLLTAEIFVPGTFILWLGLAAIAVGLLGLAFDPGWQVQIVMFGLLAIVFVVIWWRYARVRKDRDNDHPMLHRRADRHIGREFILDAPIENGIGRVRIDDTVWRIAGADCPAGTRVRVARTDGAVLIVDAVAPY